MTDRTNYCTSCKGYADRIAALEAENARLRDAGNRLLSALEIDDIDGHYPNAIKAWREVTDQPQE